MLRIKKLQTTTFHPKSNGGLERIHRILKEYLRYYIYMRIRVYGMSGYRMQYTTLLYTSFELVYGFKSSIPSALQENPSVQYNYDYFLAELKDYRQQIA
jgi:hypothetical protein